MRYSLRSLLMIGTLAFLVGCQYVPGSNFLNFGPRDAQITSNVQQALAQDPNLQPFTFHIETSEGVVYLSGYVKTIRQGDTAEMIARQVPGVRSVENNIIVRK